MITIDTITDARRALRQYLVHADGKLPAATFEQFEGLVDSPSPVDAIVRSAELLYARRDELDDDGRDLVAALAGFAAVNAWHGMADGNRGGLIAQAMARDVAGQTAPTGQTDPAPKSEFAAKVEPTVPAA